MFNFFKKKKKSSKNKYILRVVEKTGWSYDYAAAQVKDAKHRLGISSKDYEKYNIYLIPKEKQEAEYKNIVERKSRLKEQREQRIQRLMLVTGWDHDYAAKQIKGMRDRLGITFKEYMKHELYMVPEEEQKQKYESILAEKKKQLKKNRENVIAKVMSETGWERDFAKEKIADARKRTGCTYKEYLTYKFYDLADDIQEDVFLMRDSKKISAKYNTSYEIVNTLYSKELSNHYFSEYLKRPWCVNTKISLGEFISKFSNSKKVFYKPIDGHHGDGAKPFEINEENITDVFQELASYPEGVVEQYVVQHPKMSELSPAAVNTVRIVSVSSTTQPVTSGGEKIEIAYAALKMGGKNSIVDNLVGGGVVAGIDLSTGQLVTDAADEEGNVYSKHPATDKEIKGFEIPFFAEAIELVKTACEKKQLEGYLGWDIAITEDGPVMIEVNTVPGVILFSLPYALEHKGMKHVMEKFM